VFDNPDGFYIIMEYIEGKDLYERIIMKGIRDESTISKIMKIPAEALEFCHFNNVVHRDLKILYGLIQPQNILLTTNDETAVTKTVDFGLARIVGGEMMTTACDTPAYLASEILLAAPYTNKTAVWSMGVLLSHL
jgi:serine/threonine protein kinase